MVVDGALCRVEVVPLGRYSVHIQNLLIWNLMSFLNVICFETNLYSWNFWKICFPSYFFCPFVLQTWKMNDFPFSKTFPIVRIPCSLFGVHSPLSPPPTSLVSLLLLMRVTKTEGMGEVAVVVVARAGPVSRPSPQECPAVLPLLP